MSEVIHLFTRERRARVYFGVLAQSALGNGAGYVALLLIAYDRWRSPWAITLVLLADLVPAMLLGPLFGAAADRWSRKWCMILSDVLRMVAFLGIALVDSIGATLVLALVAGCGTGMYTPAALAALPGLVDRRRLPAATSVYGAVADLGFTAGPALAAVVLLFASPEGLTAANGVTFGISAILLAALRFGAAPERPGPKPASLFAEAREGLAATAGLAGIRALLGVSAGALFFAGLFNVAELPFAEDVLGRGDVGYSLLATAFGVGFIAGSLTGSRGGAPSVLKRRYQLGLLVLGVGFLGAAISSKFGLALAAFAVGGIGNGMLLVFERLLIQAAVPDHLSGRVFGVKDALSAWAFGTAFICAGGLITLIGVRELLVVAGCGGVLAFAYSVHALSGVFKDAPADGELVGAGPAAEGAVGSGPRAETVSH